MRITSVYWPLTTSLKSPAPHFDMQDRATWRIWIVLILAIALQTTWLAHWRPLGTMLDLPLICTVSVALLLGWETGAFFGLVAGVLTGYFAVFNLGSFAFSRLVTGGLFGCFDRKFSSDNPLAPSLCAAGAVLVSNLIFWLMSPTDFTAAWWLRHTIAGMLVHAIAIAPLHWVMVTVVLPPTRMMFARP